MGPATQHAKADPEAVGCQGAGLAMPRHRLPSILSLVALITVSAVGKLINIYGFFVYPDSYYYLLVGENLARHGRILGRLGQGGMPFPPAGYAATKVTYPLLVSALIRLGVGPESAGHAVAIGAAVAAVPLAYAATRRLIDSEPAAVAAAALVATSFGLTYWTGFVMTDSLSVALGFLVVWALAKSRPNEFANPGDIGTGVVVVMLLLSRPTYAAALPALLWLGAKDYAWTPRRLVSGGVAGAFIMSVVALAWFPPIGMTGPIFLRVLPVLLLALLAGGAIIFMPNVLGRARERAMPSRIATAAACAAAGLFPALFAANYLFRTFAGGYLFRGYGNFAMRDPAVIIALVPGAYVLARGGKRHVAGALLAASLSFMAVYYWVEPRESRYLVHMLPVLVPVAAAIAMPIADWISDARHCGWRFSRATTAGAICAVLLLSGLGWQANRSLRRATNSFLNTSYPKEVSRLVAPEIAKMRGDGKPPFMICTLPWPFYYHLRLPAWSIGVLRPDALFEVIPPQSDVVLLSDAALHHHLPSLAKRADTLLAKYRVFQGTVPTSYQYGYVAVSESHDVRVYRLKCADLASAIFEANRGVPATSSRWSRARR